MDFTREPIIETVITPKEGCKLVVRSSKSTGQEEYFVDAVEVVSFGHSFFFRSLERPKTFFVPATDYEVLEVREARMVLKNVGIDRTIKIAGGREAQMRPTRETPLEKVTAPYPAEEVTAEFENVDASTQANEKSTEPRMDKKRDRRRNYRRRRGRDATSSDEEQESSEKTAAEKIEATESHRRVEGESNPLTQQIVTTSILTSLLPPPPTLISETIARYKDNILFKDAFYIKEEPRPSESTPEEANNLEAAIAIQQPEYGTFEISEEEEEQIYQQRRLQISQSFDEKAEEDTFDENSQQDKEEPPHLEELPEADQSSI